MLIIHVTSIYLPKSMLWALYDGHQAMTKEGHINDDVLWCPCHSRLLPLMGRGWYSCGVTMIEKLSNSPVVTRWPPQTPLDATHTIGGRECVWGVLGEGRVSLNHRLALRCRAGALLLMTAEESSLWRAFFDGLWRIFYLGKLHKPPFGLCSCTRK